MSKLYTKNSFFPLSQTGFDVLEARPIVFGVQTPIAWKRKVDTTETVFSTLKKESNDVFTFAIDESFCLVSFDIPWELTAALFGFLIY